jgi:hypothetical protein
MPELVVGASAAAALVLLVHLARSRGIPVSFGQWALSVLAILYWVFVLETVISFLREGTPKGAVVMGTILGFVGVVWVVLLGRLVFSGRKGAKHA